MARFDRVADDLAAGLDEDTRTLAIQALRDIKPNWGGAAQPQESDYSWPSPVEEPQPEPQSTPRPTPQPQNWLSAYLERGRQAAPVGTPESYAFLGLQYPTKRATETEFLPPRLPTEEPLVAPEKQAKLPSLTWLDRYNEAKKNPETLVPFLSSGIEAVNLGRLLKTACDIESGAQVSDDDLSLLQEFVKRAQADKTWSYEVADVIANMIPFGAEFGLTAWALGAPAAASGATRLATKAGVKALVQKLATKEGAELVAKAVAKRGASFLARGTAQAAVMGVTRVPKATLEKQLNATLTGNEESVWKSAAKALGENWVEVVSESTGGAFTALTAPVKGQIVKLGLFKAFQKSNPGKSAEVLAKILNRMGYHGVLGEMFEERVGDVAHGVLNELGLSDQEFKLPSLKQLSVELVSFSVPGAAVAAVSQAAPLADKLAIRIGPILADETGAIVPGAEPGKAKLTDAEILEQAAQGAVPTLPRELTGAKPRFNIRDTSYIPEFESDVDKALFIVAQTTKSKRDADYMAWLRGIFPDTADDVIRSRGVFARNQIKTLAKEQGGGGTLKVPSLTRLEGAVLPAPGVPGKAVAPEAAPPIQAVKRTFDPGRSRKPFEQDATLVDGKFYVLKAEGAKGDGLDAYGHKAPWVVRDDATGKHVKGGFATRKEAIDFAKAQSKAAPPVEAPATMTAAYERTIKTPISRVVKQDINDAVIPEAKLMRFYAEHAAGKTNTELLHEFEEFLRRKIRYLAENTQRARGKREQSAEWFDSIRHPQNKIAQYTDNMDRLMERWLAMRNAESLSDKVIAFDSILGTTHGYGDLASWFVEGGAATLDAIRDLPNITAAAPAVEGATEAQKALTVGRPLPTGPTTTVVPGGAPIAVKGQKVPPVRPSPPTEGAISPETSQPRTLAEQVKDLHGEVLKDTEAIRQSITKERTTKARQTRGVLQGTERVVSEASQLVDKISQLALADATRLTRQLDAMTKRMERGEQVSAEDVAFLRDKVQSLKEFYKFEKQSTAEVKQKLVDYIKTQLPLPRQGELLAKVKNVKTEADLSEAITRVSQLAEEQAEKNLRADVIRELKRTVPRIEKGITIGKLTPEIQRKVESLRTTLLVGLGKVGQGIAANVKAYEDAQTQISRNITDYRQGRMSWEELIDSNESLKYTGLFGMSTLQLQETLTRVQELKQTGKDLRKEKYEAIKAKKSEVVDKSVTEVTGGKGIKPGVGALRAEDLAAAKKVLDQPVNSQYGFVNLLDKLGKFAKGTKQYQGFLMRFSTFVQRSTNTENTGREATFKQVQDKFREIYKVEKTREVTRLLEKLSNEDVDLGTFKVTTKAGVQYLSIKLTKAQMMEVYQLYKNSKNIETFSEGMHWTPEIMTKIVGALSEQDIAWADWLQNEFYDSYYDKINPFYQEEYNIDMPKNPDYVPQSRDFDAGETDEVQMLFQDQKRYASVTNKSLKARQENIRPFKLKGVFTVLSNHIVQMEHFMAWAGTMHELRSTFGNNDVRTAIRQYHSNDILKRLDDYMNDFARGGVDRAQFLNGLDKLRGRFAVSVLALKPSIGLQQIWTVGAYMTEMTPNDFVSGVADFWKHPVTNYKWMMENSAYIKARYTGGNYERDIRVAQQQGAAKTMSGQASISEFLLWQVTQGDKFGVMPGWWAKYQAGLKAGLSQADAMTQADLASDRTQNTSELSTLSWLQRGSSWGKLLTMFQSQPNKYFRIIADNLRNMQYGRQSKITGIGNVLLVWVVLPMIFQFVADAFQWKEERQKRVLLLGPLNNILVAGQLVQNAWGWFTGDSFEWQASPVLSTVRDFQNFASKTVKIARQAINPYKDISMDDVVSAVEFLAKGIGQVTGAPTPYLIQAERAIRSGDPRQLVFSKWALEKPKGESVYQEIESPLTVQERGLLARELKRLENQVGLVRSTITVDGNEFKLSDENARQYQIAAGRITNQAVLALTSTPGYGELTDKEKVWALESTIRQARAQARDATVSIMRSKGLIPQQEEGPVMAR